MSEALTARFASALLSLVVADPRLEALDGDLRAVGWDKELCDIVWEAAGLVGKPHPDGHAFIYSHAPELCPSGTEEWVFWKGTDGYVTAAREQAYEHSQGAV